MSRGKKEDLYQLPICGLNGEVIMTLSLDEDIAEQIHSREDLAWLVNHINAEISCLNQTLAKKEKLELMNLDTILKRYDKMEISRVASSVALSLHFAKVSDTTQLPKNSDDFDNSSNGL